MSASRYIKDKGFASLASVASTLGITPHRLNQWYKYEPMVFECLVDGLQWQELKDKMR